MNAFLDLVHVKKIYNPHSKNPHHALSDVTLSIQSGEVISLLGVNGAGKTTLSSIIATLHPLTSGQIFFQGKSIYKNLIEYRKQIGLCPQRPNISPYLTVREVLQFGGEIYGLTNIQASLRADELMNNFELTRYAHHTIASLSGGYKQRLMIARTLMHSPKIVILDEPTIALDAHVRKYLWQVIKNLKQTGTTVILTTHYLEEAEYLSDRVCVLHKGKIILTDSPDNLKQQFSAQNLESVFIKLLEESTYE